MSDTSNSTAETQLREISERLAAIHDRAPFGIVLSEVADGRIVSVNDAFVRIFGWTRDEAVGKTSIEVGIWTAESRRQVLEELSGNGAVHQREIAVVTKGGSRRVFSISAEPLTISSQRLIMTTLSDITERKETEDALERLRVHERELAEAMRLLMESSGQGILTVGRDGTILAANPALEAMLGWEHGELIGQTLDRLIPPDRRDVHRSHQGEYWSAPRSRPMGLGLRLSALRKDGSTVPVEVSLNHVKTAAGDRAFAFVTNISERRHAEDAIAERTRELEQRAGQLQRLASELTLTELNTREQLAKALHDHLQQILFSGRMKLDRLSKRLADHRAPQDTSLLDQVRQELDEAIVVARSFAKELFPPMLHDNGLPAALTWLAGWSREKYGLRVELTADPRANPARRDVRTLVFESVRELLFNVVKHAKTDEAEVDLTTVPGNALRITIADRGVGFDPTKVLEPGTDISAGFGLLTIRERLALLGGRLDVEAAPGMGARFTLIAPRGEAEAEAYGAVEVDEASTASEDRQLQPLRVLIADDHPLVRDGLRQLFGEQRGLQVVGEATTGKEAVAMAAALRPEAVVMDVSMPDMDGIEATRRIHKMLPEIVILGLSTSERGADPHPIEQAGAAAYFTKGDDSHRLVDRLLRIRAADDPSRD